VGDVAGADMEQIDATGRIVTPGFVDMHTHYDGQVTWENTLSPSTGHGVTTVVMGNCGVGFAPIRKDQHGLAIKLMEGVEDIPEVVMAEGLPWNWESFPEYLDALEARQADADFAAQLPHSPLRVYVMGGAGAALEPPTQAHLDEMRRVIAQAIRAGAFYGMTGGKEATPEERCWTLSRIIGRTIEFHLLSAAEAEARWVALPGNSADQLDQLHALRAPNAPWKPFRPTVQNIHGAPGEDI
jgi:N-acyl-D-aspartate/D-glutamate deacylase